MTRDLFTLVPASATMLNLSCPTLLCCAPADSLVGLDGPSSSVALQCQSSHEDRSISVGLIRAKAGAGSHVRHDATTPHLYFFLVLMAQQRARRAEARIYTMPTPCSLVDALVAPATCTHLHTRASTPAAGPTLLNLHHSHSTSRATFRPIPLSSDILSNRRACSDALLWLFPIVSTLSSFILYQAKHASHLDHPNAAKLVAECTGWV